MKKVSIRKDSYYDSVFLMLSAREIKKMQGVSDAVVAMATPMNLDLLNDLGFMTGDTANDLKKATPNDLIVAVDAVNADALEAAIKEAFENLTRKKKADAVGGGLQVAGSLDAAVKIDTDANIALISVPGAYAARETRKALEKGLHAMVFSDNVSLEDEIALKKLAVSKGLLMMGPDCGTAIINGKPLCFANKVRRGPIGIVAAAGTGLQEVSCLIDHFGSGVSQGIGTGGRDLKNAAVGGMTSLLAIDALSHDPDTKVILVVSKPPAPEVAAKVIDALRASGKFCVTMFLGLKPAADEAKIAYANDLEEAALLATILAGGESTPSEARTEIASDSGNDRYNRPSAKVMQELAKKEATHFVKEQKYLRGLYTGGTLTDEALFLAHKALGGVKSNNQTDKAYLLADPKKSEGHTIVDLGDDVFTVGKPHPMIDPAARAERIEQEGKDPSVAVILIDVVLGYGSHADPAGACVEAIRGAKENAKKRGGYVSVIASVCGTSEDYQGRASQIAKLENEGVIVMPSNLRASLLAIEIVKMIGGAK